MPLQNNRQLTSTLENLNTTLASLKEKLSNSNVQKEREIATNQVSHNFSSVSSQAQQESEIIAQSFQNAFQQAENALSSFSNQSKNQFSDLSSFIQKTLSDISLGDLISNPFQILFSSFNPIKAHSGGLVNDFSQGLQSDEIPVIARKGEAIFTPQQMESADQILSQALHSEPNVSVTVHNNTPAHVDTSTSTSSNGQINLDVVINEAEGLMARRLGLGSGLAPIIEGRYGLSPLGRG